jgi:hypothetical protein
VVVDEVEVTIVAVEAMFAEVFIDLFAHLFFLAFLLSFFGLNPDLC